MTKRFLGVLLAGFFLFQSIPLAQAVDIPLLTWERGREQNVVVGGISQKDHWQVKLLRPSSPQVILRPSSVNSKGFLVYSAPLPSDLPLGEYTVYVFGDASDSGSQVAQVKVVELTRYSITEIPMDLVILLLSLIFIITALSVTRSGEYSKLSFLRQKNLLETKSIIYAKSVPRVIYPAYLLRAGSLTNLPSTILKYFLMKDETLLHKASPMLWALFPVVGFGLGIQGGLTTHENPPNIPFYSLIAISIVGLLDSYSGIFSLLGFATGQIIVGEALTLKSTAVIISLGICWVCVGFFSDLFYSAIEKEYLRKKRVSQGWPTKMLALLLVAVAASVFYYSTLLFTQSLAIDFKNQNNAIIKSAIVMGVCASLKIVFHQFLDWKIIKNGREESLVIHEFKTEKLLSTNFLIFQALFSLFVAFIWTSNWQFSMLFSILVFAISLTFSSHLLIPKIDFLARFPRNVLIESFGVTYLCYLLYIFIRTLPYQASLKSEIFIISALVITLCHALLNLARPELEVSVKETA